MNYGYFNKLLYIDLTHQTIAIRSLPEAYWEKYVGGKCLGSRLLLDYEIYKQDPLGESNSIILLTGALTGSSVPGAAKASFYSKSPLTGIYLDSTCGGSIAFRLKSAGYDGLIITGQSDKPVYLLINGPEVKLQNAEHLWGKGCFATESELRKEYGQQCAVAVIGPGGENKVKFAHVHADFYHQFGRGGVGAQFGSKKLKGMVIAGEETVPFYNANELLNRTLTMVNQRRTDQKVVFRGQYGTLSTLDLTQKLGIVSVRNFTDGISDHYETDMNRNYIKTNYVKRNLSCFACPVPCGKGASVNYQGQNYLVGGPEYETMSLIGTNNDLSAEGTLYLNWLCDDLGIDTVSAGVLLSCITEAFTRGEISEKDLGFKLDWGNVDGQAKAYKAIAYREGLGDLLAEGSRKFGKEFGLNPDRTIQVKGMEVPGYDPRGTTGYALGYSVADRGGCHRRARPIYKEQDDDAFRFSYQGKGSLVKELEDQRAFYHSLIVCDFIAAVYPLKVKEFAELLNFATGWDYDEKEALRVGERAINQSRLFNVHCGISRKDDILPGRFFKEPLIRGNAAGQQLDPEKFQEMLSDYYAVRGWDENGVPKESKLTELGIKEVQ
jgi:aldehyde:ferredoxin oxidoreductase